MLGKLFFVNIMQLLFVITVILFVGLSEMNIMTLNIWREINLAVFFLSYSATLFHYCNYAHHFANIVRYHKTLYEHIYVYMVHFVYVTV
jgi:hypothetical protein